MYIRLLVFALGFSAIHIGAAAESCGLVTIDNSAQYVLHADRIDQDFRIDVVLPMGYQATNDNYPVVYITDSNALISTATGNATMLQLGQEMPQVFGKIIR